ncbi:hypothetical protein D3C84_565050 [compost metagenome]
MGHGRRAGRVPHRLRLLRRLARQPGAGLEPAAGTLAAGAGGLRQTGEQHAAAAAGADPVVRQADAVTGQHLAQWPDGRSGESGRGHCREPDGRRRRQPRHERPGFSLGTGCRASADGLAGQAGEGCSAGCVQPATGRRAATSGGQFPAVCRSAEPVAATLRSGSRPGLAATFAATAIDPGTCVGVDLAATQHRAGIAHHCIGAG